ncbi:hypothetical protein CF327_g1841 [Tilletia walkeri]|nr:hypothetical protein CF327_g1841 [Tilletia walkeri]
MASLAPNFASHDRRPKSAGSSIYSKPFGRASSSQPYWKSASNSPMSSIRGSRLPWNHHIDTIKESNQIASWIVFSNKNLTVPNPDQAEVRQKLVNEFPFLLDAEYAMTKTANTASRPRLFSFASAPSILVSSNSLPNLNSLRLSFVASEERSVMRVKLVTETRALAWRPIAAVTEEQASEEVKTITPLECLPGEWSLRIDTRATAQRALAKGPNACLKRTFELEDMRRIAACVSCDGSSLGKCSDCNGLDAAGCFWCNSSGRRRGAEAKKACNHCKGHGRTYCSTCKNSGKNTCTTCEGKGKALMGLFVDVKVSVREMPAVSLSSLLRSSGTSTPVTLGGSNSGPSTPSVSALTQLGMNDDNEMSIKVLASTRIEQLANDFLAAQDDCVNPAQPVLAICEFERFSIHTVVVGTSEIGTRSSPSPPGSSSSDGSGPLSGFLNATNTAATCKSPAPSSKSTRSIFRRRSGRGSFNASATPSFWTFKVASSPGVPPVQVA